MRYKSYTYHSPKFAISLDINLYSNVFWDITAKFVSWKRRNRYIATFQ